MANQTKWVRERQNRLTRERNVRLDKEGAIRAKFHNEYMEKQRLEMEELSREKPTPCVFCLTPSVPGEDLCPKCKTSWNEYMGITDDENRSERADESFV